MVDVKTIGLLVAAMALTATYANGAITWQGDDSADMNVLSNWDPAPASLGSLVNEDMTVNAVVGPNLAPVATYNVPEPASVGLLIGGALIALSRRKISTINRS